MKKYFVIILLLSIAGIFISNLLLIQHFNIGSGIVNFFCGNAADDSCRSISSSGYSTFLSFPVASFAVLFYCFIAITSLIAIYAEDIYYNLIFLLLSIFIIISLLVSITFVILMIKINTFCRLCAAIHFINLLLFTDCAFCYKLVKSDTNFKIPDVIRNFILSVETISHARAALSAFIMLLIFMTISVFSTIHILDLKTAKSRVPRNALQKFEESFNNTKPEDIVLHKSSLVTGNKEGILTITVFTDFLCTYCYELYQIEEYLISEFNYRIKFEHYNYPLDSDCNKAINHTVYKNSCIASKAMLAAAELGIFEKYLATHFSNYKLMKSSEYDLNMALTILYKSGYRSRKDEFLKLINSNDVMLKLGRDIDSAKKVKISGTPTIFIANKRIRGLPPKDALERVIYNEFIKKTGSN